MHVVVCYSNSAVTCIGILCADSTNISAPSVSVPHTRILQLDGCGVHPERIVSQQLAFIRSTKHQKKLHEGRARENVCEGAYNAGELVPGHQHHMHHDTQQETAKTRARSMAQHNKR